MSPLPPLAVEAVVALALRPVVGLEYQPVIYSLLI
jgi:hypothetical protein